MTDVLDISQPVYYINNEPISNPIGAICSRIEARYKLITGRPNIRKSIITSVENANLQFAGIIISPLAIADLVFSDKEKAMGCLLINFGYGVTSAVVIKNGSLLHLSVIPFGGSTITKDIMTLKLTEAEAERLKTTYGSAIYEKDDVTKTIEDISGNELNANDLNIVVEARIKEIVENVYARVENIIPIRSLNGGIKIAGGASALKNLKEFIGERFGQKVSYATISSERIDTSTHNKQHGYDHVPTEEIITNPANVTAISLLFQGRVNCIKGEEKEGPIVTRSVGNKDTSRGKPGKLWESLTDTLFKDM
jgi:cell division protein FtsA